jgi:serine phosphatase RsbU (regulator of sigma subunit)
MSIFLPHKPREMALAENLPIITTGVVGVATSIAAWILGGKHHARNEFSNSLTEGTDKIVDSTKKLLERMEQMLEQETERVNIERLRVNEEREHRENCENALKEVRAEIELLKKRK